MISGESLSPEPQEDTSKEFYITKARVDTSLDIGHAPALVVKRISGHIGLCAYSQEGVSQ